MCPGRRTGQGPWRSGLGDLDSPLMPSYDDGMRTIVEIPEDQVRMLAVVCRRERISRAEAIRRAVAEYARQRTMHGAANAFGLWRGRSLEGLRYQERLRREW